MIVALVSLCCLGLVFEIRSIPIDLDEWEKGVHEVPIGSSVSDLPKYWGVGDSVSGGEVIQWNGPEQDKDLGSAPTPQGKSSRVSLGSYTGWRPSAKVAEEFTGEIMFHHSLPFSGGDLSAQMFVHFYYTDGELSSAKCWQGPG